MRKRILINWRRDDFFKSFSAQACTQCNKYLIKEENLRLVKWCIFFNIDAASQKFIDKRIVLTWLLYKQYI